MSVGGMTNQQIYDVLNDAYFSEEPHEAELLDDLPRLIADDATLLVDIGASLGQYTRRFSEILKAGRIIAFEADPIRAEELQRNATKWSRAELEIDARHCALADETGSTTFYTTQSNVSGALDPSDVPVDSVPITVPTDTLDRVLAGAVPQFVKIDVEGAELRVLAGATELLERGETAFLIEVHEGHDDEVNAYMARFGYRPIRFHQRTVYATRRLWWRLKPAEVMDRARHRLSPTRD